MSLKLPYPLMAMLEAAARQRRTTKSAVLREALEAHFANGSRKPKVSAYDLVKDLCGVFDGPPDLSTNPKYLRGYGR
jgi:hypothetical protein